MAEITTSSMEAGVPSALKITRSAKTGARARLAGSFWGAGSAPWSGPDQFHVSVSDLRLVLRFF